eukprot:gnl/MRDRNA2_/MRDRNA2_85691_c0_seq1.p1 gnl/MRDRNA2_/MRDRNA2_85691_c0~~gnl/MRDRNA2_/MRDRNA2_85691_c0_seq1.p1  ORF type:complete len:388 (+),score=-18.06 gnl/MRDRNA2_/MRDRNA2_85691_c0_seq1:124-1287(+)
MDGLESCYDQFACRRELERADRKAKIAHILAKPLKSVFEHSDSVTCLTQIASYPNNIISGSADGKIQSWDTKTLRCCWQLSEHSRAVTGLASTHNGGYLVSSSLDCKALLWKLSQEVSKKTSCLNKSTQPISFNGKNSFLGIDHNWVSPRFITVGSVVEVWEHSRNYPLQSYKCGAEMFTCVRFNSIDPDVFITCSTNHSVLLYDLRASVPIQRLSMKATSNAISWDPFEILNFTTANDDCNLYTFDIRKMKSALLVHKDFVSSVLDVDYCPKGQEFVAGSLDNSVRIFGKREINSREIYHTNRMQRVLTVKFSVTGQFVFSGSDDMNVRVWKSTSNGAGFLSNKQRNNEGYSHALMLKCQRLKWLNKSIKNRFIPKPIFFLSIFNI